MRKSRVYVDSKLKEGESICLLKEQARYLRSVLRLESGAELILFDGRGGEFEARIERAERGAVEARVGAFVDAHRESPLKITLVQALSRGDRMDFTVQKAVELGVYAIVPVIAERSMARPDDARRARRLEHWRGIAVNACQQCGRTRLPRIEEISRLDERLEAGFEPTARFVLSPDARLTVAELDPVDEAVLLVGAEGGLSDGETARALKSGFLPLALGPRILRTETAAVAAVTALQLRYGDLSVLS